MPAAAPDLPSSPAGFTAQITRVLCGTVPVDRLFPDPAPDSPVIPSSVLFLLGSHAAGEPGRFDPRLILNKRSGRVPQPGDLCCPGGGISPRTDLGLSRLLRLPGSPLARWACWGRFRRRHPESVRPLSLLLATSLRESFEEMRLNPLRVTFLGPMPPEHLVMFRRRIHPMVGWVTGPQRFIPNWEVDRIVRLPLKTLLDPGRYARLRPDFAEGGPSPGEFPCFIHTSASGETELLWGATYRITVHFLELVFGFHPPHPDGLRVVTRRLGRRYLAGSRPGSRDREGADRP